MSLKPRGQKPTKPGFPPCYIYNGGLRTLFRKLYQLERKFQPPNGKASTLLWIPETEGKNIIVRNYRGEPIVIQKR